MKQKNFELNAEEKKITEGPYELPEGWKWVRLGNRDVAEIIMGQSPPASTYNQDRIGIPFFQGKADFGELFPTPRIWCNKPNKIAESEDILISVRAPVGPVNLCDERSCIGRGLAAIRPKPDYLNYFYFFLYLKNIERDWTGKGSTFGAIKKRDLENLLIPLPPIEEQKRIVTRIEELFGKLDETKRLRKEAVEEAKALLPSALHEVFSKADERGWRWVKVIDISEKPQYGYTAVATVEPIGPKMIRITDIQNGEVDWDFVPYCKISKKEVDKYRLKEGDILFARTGATTGKTFLIKNCPNTVFASYLIRVKLDKSRATPEYIYHFFQSPYYWKQIKPRGGAQPNMNARVLSKLLIPLPSLEEQKRIVAYLDKIQEKANALQKIQEETEKEVEKLREALLYKAFRGNL